MRRYVPKILGRNGQVELGIKLALLLFAALLMSLDADLTFARDAAAQAAPATSVNEVAGHGNATQGSLPAATAETAEHHLSQKAVEIARPFGFPITNSMVVTWIVAAGPDHFCPGRYAGHEACSRRSAEFLGMAG